MTQADKVRTGDLLMAGEGLDPDREKLLKSHQEMKDRHNTGDNISAHSQLVTEAERKFPKTELDRLLDGNLTGTGGDKRSEGVDTVLVCLAKGIERKELRAALLRKRGGTWVNESFESADGWIKKIPERFEYLKTIVKDL